MKLSDPTQSKGICGNQIYNTSRIVPKQNAANVNFLKKDHNLSFSMQSHSLNGSLLSRSKQDPSESDAIILKRFEEYFEGSSRYKGPNQKIKMVHQIMGISSDHSKGTKGKQIFASPTTQDSASLTAREKRLLQLGLTKNKRAEVYTSSSRSNYSKSQATDKEDLFKFRGFLSSDRTKSPQTAHRTKGQNLLNSEDDFVLKQKFKIQKNKNRIETLLTRGHSRQRQKNNHWTNNPAEVDISKILHGRSNQRTSTPKAPENSSYFIVDKSNLLDRKFMSSQICPDSSNKSIPSHELIKEQKAKSFQRKMLLSRKKSPQERKKDETSKNFSSPQKSKFPIRKTYLEYLNPNGKTPFSLSDLANASAFNSKVGEVKVQMNGCFFSVFVQEGNNSQLIKSIVRNVCGWRVAQTQIVANLVWTQSLRKNLTLKKPKKSLRGRSFDDPQLQDLKNKDIEKTVIDKPMPLKFQNPHCAHEASLASPKLGNKFLLNRNKLKQSAQGSEILERSISISRSKKGIKVESKQICPEVTYEKHLGKIISHRADECFEIASEDEFAKIIVNPNCVIHNHLTGHRAISDKKYLLENMKSYYEHRGFDPFDFLPFSTEVQSFLNSEFVHKQNILVKDQKQKLLLGETISPQQELEKQLWIIKPSEDSNRGRGIVVCQGWASVIEDLKSREKQFRQKSKNMEPKSADISTSKSQFNCKNLDQEGPPEEETNLQHQNGSKRVEPQPIMGSKNGSEMRKSVILQRYIMPMLYQKRKFDIRSFMLITYVNNVMNGYAFDECYVRTCSKPFDPMSQNKFVHLTNDAVQYTSTDYGKYEEGNKVSEAVFEKYWNEQICSTKNGQNTRKHTVSRHWGEVKKEMTERTREVIEASADKLVGAEVVQKCKNSHKNIVKKDSQVEKLRSKGSDFEMSFQLFGLDFLIDEQQKLWLIEVNTNPALNHQCCRNLNKLMPKLLENTLAIAVMPFMKPTKLSEVHYYNNQFSHIFRKNYSKRV